MSDLKAKYQYTIEDTINGLTIHYQGTKRWGAAVLIVMLAILVLLIMIPMMTEILNDPTIINTNDYVPMIVTVGILMAGLLYGLFIYLTWALDLLLDDETITIDAHSIRVEKSGFGSFHLSKEYTLKGNTIFHMMVMNLSNVISFSRYKLTARLSQHGSFRYWIHPSPMRWFCRRISASDGALILSRIKSKFPQYDFFREQDPIVGPG
jgi:hypothetical protein